MRQMVRSMMGEKVRRQMMGDECFDRAALRRRSGRLTFKVTDEGFGISPGVRTWKSQVQGYGLRLTHYSVTLITLESTFLIFITTNLAN